MGLDEMDIEWLDNQLQAAEWEERRARRRAWCRAQLAFWLRPWHELHEPQERPRG
jgi:hypothetical protein